MNTKFNVIAFGLAGAITAAILMLIFGILSRFGIYTEATTMMTEWHLFFSPTPTGILAGMVEGAISAFIASYLFAIICNNIDHITKR